MGLLDIFIPKWKKEFDAFIASPSNRRALESFRENNYTFYEDMQTYDKRLLSDCQTLVTAEFLPLVNGAIETWSNDAKRYVVDHQDYIVEVYEAYQKYSTLQKRVDLLRQRYSKNGVFEEAFGKIFSPDTDWDNLSDNDCLFILHKVTWLYAIAKNKLDAKQQQKAELKRRMTERVHERKALNLIRQQEQQEEMLKLPTAHSILSPSLVEMAKAKFNFSPKEIRAISKTCFETEVVSFEELDDADLVYMLANEGKFQRMQFMLGYGFTDIDEIRKKYRKYGVYKRVLRFLFEDYDGDTELDDNQVATVLSNLALFDRETAILQSLYDNPDRNKYLKDYLHSINRAMDHNTVINVLSDTTDLDKFAEAHVDKTEKIKELSQEYHANGVYTRVMRYLVGKSKNVDGLTDEQVETVLNNIQEFVKEKAIIDKAYNTKPREENFVDYLHSRNCLFNHEGIMKCFASQEDFDEFDNFCFIRSHATNLKDVKNKDIRLLAKLENDYREHGIYQRVVEFLIGKNPSASNITEEQMDKILSNENEFKKEKAILDKVYKIESDPKYLRGFLDLYGYYFNHYGILNGVLDISDFIRYVKSKKLEYRQEAKQASGPVGSAPEKATVKKTNPGQELLDKYNIKTISDLQKRYHDHGIFPRVMRQLVSVSDYSHFTKEKVQLVLFNVMEFEKEKQILDKVCSVPSREEHILEYLRNKHYIYDHRGVLEGLTNMADFDRFILIKEAPDNFNKWLEKQSRFNDACSNVASRIMGQFTSWTLRMYVDSFDEKGQAKKKVLSFLQFVRHGFMTSATGGVYTTLFKKFLFKNSVLALGELTDHAPCNSGDVVAVIGFITYLHSYYKQDLTVIFAPGRSNKPKMFNREKLGVLIDTLEKNHIQYFDFDPKKMHDVRKYIVVVEVISDLKPMHEVCHSVARVYPYHPIGYISMYAELTNIQVKNIMVERARYKRWEENEIGQ